VSAVQCSWLTELDCCALLSRRCRKGATAAAAVVAAAAAAAQQAAAASSGSGGHSAGSHSRVLGSTNGLHYSSSAAHTTSLATQLIERGILDACRAVSYCVRTTVVLHCCSRLRMQVSLAYTATATAASAVVYCVL
jgi:hypothetical protein